MKSKTDISGRRRPALSVVERNRVVRGAKRIDNNRRFFGKCTRGSSSNRRALPWDGARPSRGAHDSPYGFCGAKGARRGRLDSIRGRLAARELHGRPLRLDRPSPRDTWYLHHARLPPTISRIVGGNKRHRCHLERRRGWPAVMPNRENRRELKSNGAYGRSNRWWSILQLSLVRSKSSTDDRDSRNVLKIGQTSATRSMIAVIFIA